MYKKEILHLVTKLPDKYNGKFIEFSQNYLDEYQHTFIALVSSSVSNEERDINGANVIYLNDLNRYQKMVKLKELFLSEKYDLIIFHGLSYTGPFLAFLTALFKFTTLAERTLWMTWGGDIYYFQNRPKGFLGYVNECLRKSIIKKFYFISSLLPEECELIRLNYKTRALEFDAFYPNPLDYTTSNALPTEESKLRIMLGNSADPQNNHLEMLNSLSHLAKNVKIYCVLSYAIVDTAYVTSVINTGKKLFGKNFVAITDFMNIDDYKLLIDSIDFACYFHNRQQAMGNVFQFLNMGKTVFIRHDVLSSQFLMRHGLPIENSHALANITLEELQRLKKVNKERKALNKSIIQEYFAEPAAKIKWKKSLDKMFAIMKKQ